MTPQEKLDLAIKSVEVLKLLNGDNLASLSNENKAILTTGIVDAYKEIEIGSESIDCDRDILAKKLFLAEYYGSNPPAFWPPKDIAELWFSMCLGDVNIRKLNQEVVKLWRDKYGYSTDVRPCRDNFMSTYLYNIHDWELIGEALNKPGVKLN